MAYGAVGRLRKRAVALTAALTLAVAPALAAPVTVAALGDSLTQGYGLPPAQGFVPQLNAWLAEQGAEATVLNAGVSGDTTAGGLSRVEWTLTPEVDAMIVALGGNDLLRGIDPASSRANLDAILAKAGERGIPVLLIGMVAPGNYGPEFKRDFDAIYPDLAETHDTLYAPSFLGALERMDDRQATLARYIQGDGIHPNAEGVKLIVQDLGPKVLDLIEQAAD
ncbi:arylesterase [Oceaniglobus trochenteri]|uniref:arylesterase n=1 Tax=Oceaniglobus trochenteri TaxID=2763260 RepID=UPI001CFFAD5E|nr:arylesterase [Oceaniglobus trochenteri]